MLEDFKICVAENTGAYQIETITSVVCYFGDEVADTLVDESGNAQGLVEVSAPGAVMSFKGVVKSKYLEYGNGELSCTGECRSGSDSKYQVNKVSKSNSNIRLRELSVVNDWKESIVLFIL